MRGDQVIMQGGGIEVRGVYRLVKKLPGSFWQVDRIKSSLGHRWGEGTKVGLYLFREGPALSEQR